MSTPAYDATDSPSVSQSRQEGNVGFRLKPIAQRLGEQAAIIELSSRRSVERYRQITFEALDRESDRLAAGLRALGIPAGARLVLAIPPGIDFVASVIAMLKARLVMVLIDPGMPKRHLIRCLSEARPDGFVAVGRVHLVRAVLRNRFPSSKFHIVAGGSRLWGHTTLDQLRACKDPIPDEPCSLHDPAAVIFTTGSTGPPKGVYYEHLQFARQIDWIRERFGLQEGECDLAAFPLFGLFNSMMGTTTIFPAMDYTQPAAADPKHILDVIRRWKITRSFGSPAFWNTVVGYCDRADESLSPLKTVFSAGAPVPAHVIERLLPRLAEDGDIWTPYGATEALPVAAMSGREVLLHTAASTGQGRGTCVGQRFPGIRWKVIAISDEPIETIHDCRFVPAGQIGELIVQGDVVTSKYVTRSEANAEHKIADGDQFWHRMGDVGYLDEDDRFWFCGRKTHRVMTAEGTLYTVCCEAVFNEHPDVYRSALVGLGQRTNQTPILVVEPLPARRPRNRRDWLRLRQELRELAQQHDHTRPIREFLWRKKLPTDIRHNSKIFREQLQHWAAGRLRR